MPKVRRWFADGRDFVNGQVNIPSCCPSRSTLLTGRYAHNTGVRHQADAKKLDMRTTLERRLSDAGYRTMMAGKFLNSWPLNQAPPDFDEYAAIHGGYDGFNVLDSDSSRVHWKQGQRNYSTTWLAERLGQFIDDAHNKRSAKPWFAYYAPYAPHRPSTPSAEYDHADVRKCLEPNESDRSDKPPFIRSTKYKPSDFAALCKDQLRTLLSVDDAVDSIMKKIDSYGELGNTIVVFTSDNGYLWGEHGRMSKFVPYLPAMRVPFLIRWPGHVDKGKDTRLASTVDLAPTLLEAAGVPIPSNVDGRSLLGGSKIPIVFGEYWEDHENGGVPDWASSFDGRWHYAEYYSASGKVTFTELYDVSKDPAEDHNLAVEQGHVDPAFHQKLKELRAS